MHDTAYTIGRLFFENYWRSDFGKVVDLGSLDVNGTLRECAPAEAVYVGLDIEPGKGVDIVITGDSKLPLADNATDMVVSSSVLEHDQFFWNTFLELVRITRPGGYIYVNAPSNGYLHRYPADNWRFYADASRALERWAAHSGAPVRLVESFIAERMGDVWNDFVAVFSKGDQEPAPPKAYLCDLVPCTNVWRNGESGLLKLRERTEDMVLLARAREAEAEAPQAADLRLLEQAVLERIPASDESQPDGASAQPDLAVLQSGLDRLIGDMAERRVFQDQLIRRLAYSDSEQASAMAAAHQRLAQVESENAGLRARLSEIEQKSGRLEGEVADLRQHQELLEGEARLLQSTQAGLRQDHAALESECVRLRALNAEWERALEAENQRRSTAESALRTAINALDKAVALQGEVSARNGELERQLLAWASDNNGLRDEVADLQNAAAISATHASNLEQQIALMKSSTSWRLTRPVRAMKDVFGSRR